MFQQEDCHAPITSGSESAEAQPIDYARQTWHEYFNKQLYLIFQEQNNTLKKDKVAAGIKKEDPPQQSLNQKLDSLW